MSPPAVRGRLTAAVLQTVPHDERKGEESNLHLDGCVCPRPTRKQKVPTRGWLDDVSRRPPPPPPGSSRPSVPPSCASDTGRDASWYHAADRQNQNHLTGLTGADPSLELLGSFFGEGRRGEEDTKRHFVVGYKYVRKMLHIRD